MGFYYCKNADFSSLRVLTYENYIVFEINLCTFTMFLLIFKLAIVNFILLMQN